MKKMIVAATFLALAGANLQTAKASDCGWVTAGQILTGIAVGVAVANTVHCQPAYYPVTYASCAPYPTTVVHAPAPVVVYPRPVFITPRPLVNVNYVYGRGNPGRGHGHGHRR